MLQYIALQGLCCLYVKLFCIFFLESESSSRDKILLVLFGILLGIIFLQQLVNFKRGFSKFLFFSWFNQEIITNVKTGQQNMNYTQFFFSTFLKYIQNEIMRGITLRKESSRYQTYF